ncbi:PASTA domain-containing protein [Micromonospora mangrovi]|uniref:PASTA domain-containing protein n=2 Tax=Micromonospora TaxID=1873 RepID=A0AAU8HAZ3_9ACTN
MSNDRQEPPAGENVEATRPLPRADRSGPPDPDATRPVPGADATRPLPRPDATARQRPVSDAPTRQEPAAWSGRAGVPPPRPAEQSTEWYTEEQAGRRWWMPILLGILALVLLALIGLGVWLALRAADEGPAPAPTPSLRPTTAPTTSAAPSTPPPTTPPATTAAAQVPMPPLVGLPEATARGILDRLGVDYRVRTRTSEQPAGTVIETDPEAGEPVREGERVTVVVAAAAAPTSDAGTPTPAPSATATP